MGIIWVLLVVAVFTFNVDYYYNRKLVGATGTTAWVLVLASIILLIIAGLSSGFPKDVTTKLWRTDNIHSLKDAGTNYQGSFVLGSGTIKSEAYYTAYVHTDDGFHKEKFRQEMTYIKEVDGVTPIVEKYVEVTTANWLEGWLIGKTTKNGCCYTKYILHVPKDTIIKKFRLE